MTLKRTTNHQVGNCRRSALAILLLLAAVFRAGAVSLQDYFTNRETIVTLSGTLLGDNSTATFEVGEPNHGGKRGGHSLWISWIAPTNGVATFDTHGSGFDTLLSAYTLNPTNATTVDRLHEEARNDDDPGFQPTSLIQIGAIAGHRYEIAVDGYEGATGTVAFHWSFLPSASPPPIIISTPNDESAKQGDQVTLNVNMTTSGNLQLAWFFNGVEDTVQTTATYVIASLQDVNVGRYQLRVTVGNGNNRVRFFTTPVEIQINSEGSTNTLAQDKLLDASGSALQGEDGTGGGGPHVLPIPLPPRLGSIFLPRPKPRPADLGVVRGYNGSQVFNTTFATIDPAEPPHCGVKGGASYWLMYQPPTNGTVTLDTLGSTYDTVMEVYTFNGALKTYADLISITCDNDNLGAHGGSRVTFQTIKTRAYVVVVDGVAGARGTAWLNYVLNTNLPPQAPTLQTLEPGRTVVAGANLTLAPAIVGVAPLQYSWRKNASLIPGAQSSFLPLTNLAVADSGDYSLTVTNDLGTLVVTIPVRVVIPPSCSIDWTAKDLRLSFPTMASNRYTIEHTTSLPGPWLPWAPPFVGDGQTFATNILGPGTRFFRLHIE